MVLKKSRKRKEKKKTTFFADIHFSLQWLFVDSGLLKCLYRALQHKEPSRYKVIQDAILSEEWPPVGQTVFASANSHDVAIAMNNSTH